LSVSVIIGDFFYEKVAARRRGWELIAMPSMTLKTRAGTNFDVPAAVLISLVVQTTISLFAAGIPVLAPAIVAERGWNATVIAFYPTVVYITAFLISFQVPVLLFRLGGMGLSLACVAICAAGILFLLSPYGAAAALAAFAIGCATAAMNPASSQVLGPRTTARTAGLVMSIKQTGVPLGGVVAGALLPVLVLRSGWRAAALELAVIGATLVIVLLPAVRWLNGGAAPARPTAFRPLDPVKRLLASPGMLTLLLASVTFNGMQVCLRSFFTVYLATDQRLSLVAAGVAFSVSQAAGMVGQVLWAALSDRLLSVRAVMAIIGILMTAASFCTAAMTPDWPFGAIMLVAAVYGVSAAGYLPVLLGEVARRSPPGLTGALTSGAQLFPLGGCIVGPLAFGGMAVVIGMPAAFLLAGACTLAGTLILAAPVRFFAGSTAAAGAAKPD
jgi:MFS family permease